MRFRPLLLLGIALSLTACNGNSIKIISPVTVPPEESTDVKKSPDKATPLDNIFKSALSKRSLPLPSGQTSQGNSDSSNEDSVSNTTGVSSPSLGAPEPAAAPQAESAQDISVIEPGFGGSRFGPYFGGGNFNNYVIQFAEDIIFPGSKQKNLLGVYKERIGPLLLEWDGKARLIETRGQSANNNNIEYVQVIGDDSKSLRIKPSWTFRYSSTTRKETLNIYVTEKETRVHRLVWGEPDIDLSKVKIDSNEAYRLAKKAFANKSLTGPMVYPQNNQGQRVLYDIPEDANWQLNLNQQGQDKLRYFIDVSFGNTSQPQIAPGIAVGEPHPDFEVDHQRFYGSAEVDARTGKILNLNRPVDWSRPIVSRPTRPPEPVEIPIGEDPEGPVVIDAEPDTTP